MNNERKRILLENKIYVPRKKKRGGFLTLCQLRVIQSRIKSANIYLKPYVEASHDVDAIHEHIYRYATEDTEIKLCSQCKNERTKFISIEYGWHIFCSNSCSAKHKVENGIGNASKSGWKHTEETKRKMSINHADISGDKNPIKRKILANPLYRKTMSKTKADYWKNLSEDEKKKVTENFSIAQSLSKADKKSYGRGHKSGYYFSKKMNKQMFYRSSWELQVCEFLDKEDNNVIYFDIEPFAIEYKLEDGEKRYTRIDFHIVYSDGRQMIVEVKPAAFLEEGNVPFKIKGCKEYAELNNINFVVVTQKELKNLEEILV